MIRNSLFAVVKKNSRFIKYCVGGGFAFLADLSLLYVLTEYFGFWYLWSATLSFIISAIVNYAIQKLWTFKDKNKAVTKQLLAFLSIQIVGLGINNLTLYCLVEFFELWYIIAKIFAAGIVLIWNYQVGKALVFRVKKETSRDLIVVAGEIFPPDIGGPATYVYQLVRYLLAERLHFSALYYARSELADHDRDLAPFLTTVSGFLPLPIKYLVYFFRLLARSFHAKVIYAQGPVASGWPALLVSKILQKKLIVKVVGDYAWEQAMLGQLTRQGVDSWQAAPELHARNYFLNLKIKSLNFLERLVVRHADGIIVPSYYLKKIVLGWGADQEKIRVIYNAIFLKDKPTLSREAAQEKIKIKGDIIITAVRLLPWKGVAMLIKIMRELKNINPDFKLVVAGGGPEEVVLRKMAAEYELTDKVFLLGSISQDELAIYYQAASIFVLNSGYEGLSHVVLDAMHYRLPIIASNIGGNPELIQDDYNGLLVEYNDYDAWLKAVDRLWRDHKLRERLASSPLVKLDIFNFNKMVAETMRIINSF
ncbi:hypothetical protein A3H03_03285 [Candidatus Kuenenbacteria bacterium RIFCSPLOWO2_12_FULL_42_13]|uniref:Glycosyl transferase family 1 domain-containing protein n=4 Tax=Candidatus Kueneniibacteriota TaxID=1752740 RepID=A0A1F6G312_9BACT|nr:MAG: hypothetical protein A3H03_03285 [Candidatus Kuenenbacteria bacterium RIFCSPLOWO2_12_FULL_42_13]OGG95585.1 MAG: hypothetical protein A2V95_01360 [Candidatus Kuenenbacteria bacterium RBG_16_41_7]